MEKPSEQSTRNVAYLIVFLGGMFIPYQFLLQGTPSLMVPSLMQDLSINLVQVGFISSSFFYPYLLLQIPAGILVDKYGARKILLISTCLLALSTAFFASTQTLVPTVVARVFMGACSAPGVACAMWLAAKWCPKNFAFIACLLEMVGVSGGAVGDYTLPRSIASIGAANTMYIVASVGLLLLIGIFLFVKDGPVDKHKIEVASNEPGNKSSTKDNLRAILTNKFIWQACFYGAFMFALISAFSTLWAIPYLSSLYPGQAQWADNATGLVFIGAAVGTLSSGYFATRLNNIKRVMQIYAVIALIAFSIILYIPIHQDLMLLMLFIAGVASGAYALPFSCVKSAVTAEAQGMAMGLTNMMIMLVGAPIFQPLIGWLTHLLTAGYFSGVDISNTAYAYSIALSVITLGLFLAVILSFTIKGRKT